MAFDLRISNRAAQQIDLLAAYLKDTLENPQACRHFFDEIEESFNALKENPYCYKLCLESFLAYKGYRSAKLSSMQYRIIFRIDEDTVFIVGVFHTLENYSGKI